MSAVMSKYALSYGSQRPRLKGQPDVRSAYTQFFRPIFPAKGPVSMKIQELSIGRSWSILRMETYQGDLSKLAATSDVLYASFVNQAESFAPLTVV